MDIDTRARNASAALRASVRDSRDRRSVARARGGLRIVITLVLALVCGAGAIALVERRADDRVGTGVGDLPAYAPDWLPDGMVLREVLDMPPAREATTRRVWFIGRPDAPASFVYEQFLGAFGDQAGEPPEPIDLGWVAAVELRVARGDRFTTEFAWATSTSQNNVWSFTEPRQAVLDLARAIATADGAPGDAIVAAGYEVLDVDDGSWMIGASGSRTGHRALRWSDDTGSRTISVSVGRGSGEHPAAEELFGVGAGDVRGRRAWRAPDTDRGRSRLSLTWLEQPGVYVTVVASEGEDTARRVAESLHLVGDDEWASLGSAAKPGPERALTIADYEVLLEGRTSSGLRWELAQRRRAPLGTLALIAGREGEQSLGGVSESGRSGALRFFADRGQGVEPGGYLFVVYGMAPAEVARVVVETTGPSYNAAVGEARDGRRPFAVAVEPYSTVRVRTFDAAGTELAELPSVENPRVR